MLFPSQIYIDTCSDIENDQNYRPGIKNAELLALVADENGIAKHHPPKQAIAIQRSSIRSSLGRLYEVKATHNQPDWHVDDSLIILVNKDNGNVSFHPREKALQGNFTFGIPYFLPRHVLNKECLHNTSILGSCRKPRL